MVDKVNYNPWPNGHVPEELQRPELKQLKEAGYVFDDARDAVEIFEKKVAEFAGSKHAISIDSCTHGLELSLRYYLSRGWISHRMTVFIPANTYISIYWMLKQLGFSVRFEDKEWCGEYEIEGTGVWDSAVMWRKGMFNACEGIKCVSFQIKKTIPIGRGGMVLTNDKEAADFIRLASYDGRDLTVPYDHPDHVKMNGWHYYMEPESAARGILLMDQIKTETDSIGWENYPDIRKMLKI